MPQTVTLEQFLTLDDGFLLFSFVETEILTDFVENSTKLRSCPFTSH